MSFSAESSATVEAFNQYVTEVQNKLTGFEASQADLVSNIPSLLSSNMGKTLFVNPTTGNNSNDGLSWDTAVATIEGAAAKVPVGGRGTIYLKSGVTHQMVEQVDVENRAFVFIAESYDYYVASTYVPIQAIMVTAEDNTVRSGGFKIGRRSLMRFIGCQLLTGKYTTAQASLTKHTWYSSFISSIGSKGTVFLEHCLVQINNGQLTHQHTGGSIGSVDLYMRNVTISITPTANLVVAERFPYLVGQYSTDAMPFFLFGIEMTKPSGVTWASLIYATLTYATTNLKD